MERMHYHHIRLSITKSSHLLKLIFHHINIFFPTSSVNKISTLQHFQDCMNLQELYLRRNGIQDINEIEYLQNLPNLKYLWLEENPCCDQAGDNYRPIVLRALPNLKKLDNVDVTPEEVDEAMNAGPIPPQQHQQEIDEDEYEDSYQDQQQYQPPQPQYTAPSQQQSHPQQQQQQPQQQQQRVAYSPPTQVSLKFKIRLRCWFGLACLIYLVLY